MYYSKYARCEFVARTAALGRATNGSDGKKPPSRCLRSSSVCRCPRPRPLLSGAATRDARRTSLINSTHSMRETRYRLVRRADKVPTLPIQADRPRGEFSIAATVPITDNLLHRIHRRRFNIGDINCRQSDDLLHGCSMVESRKCILMTNRIVINITYRVFFSQRRPP